MSLKESGTTTLFLSTSAKAFAVLKTSSDE